MPVSIWHIAPDSWVPGSACTKVKFLKEGTDMDLALCRNESCPSRGHCFRFTALASEHQVYACFTVRPKEDRCDYYIPNKIEKEGK